jgi:hypothetical protein
MRILTRLPAMFALLLLAAHFLRAGAPPLTALALVLMIPAGLSWPTGRTIAGWALALGALLWLQTLAQTTQARLETGAPWTRLVLILASVAIFTGWAGWLLRPWPLKPRA